MLQERLDGAAAIELAAELSKLPCDGTVVLDGSRVTHFGALALQVVLSAGKTFLSGGGTIRCVDLPDRAASHLAAMGIDGEKLMEVVDDA